MTKERLEEIKDSIEFQMQIQQAIGYKSRYDDLLTEEIDLYNEVIELQERINKAIEYIDTKVVSNGEIIDQLRKIEIKQLLEILKGEPNND